MDRNLQEACKHTYTDIIIDANYVKIVTKKHQTIVTTIFWLLYEEECKKKAIEFRKKSKISTTK